MGRISIQSWLREVVVKRASKSSKQCKAQLTIRIEDEWNDWYRYGIREGSKWRRNVYRIRIIDEI